ncbi:phytoene synthase [Streptomyces sp. KhCrAH-43]|uniref:phytoene/squalene synthase family protein n=1 Tax=unclassified Streptomyces TaxID=2593676 RepID=UPI00037852E8|nr:MULTISPECIES: squalene/phytoene synthase family protein [unclassified Streptomyces]MYS33536.1 squalene/phytoene synthase family protein [Streptomyces sp. SID4920]MYX63872.1 squalene/phytoene synthase family protein [Streptomyces sp. SID8373]RAJ52768.1 phytoene synthase [Streptomyces sp. KhCrAH-43]
MPTWTRTLHGAGITDPDLQAAYGHQRTLVKRFKTEEYLTVRLLLPAHLHPPVIAAVAFMHETDQRIDTGTADARQQALGEWGRATREVLDGAPAASATLQVLRDAVSRHPQLRQRVEDFLHGARHEVDYAGFDTEVELQTYIDGYSLPAFMLLACLLMRTPKDGADTGAFEDRCRDLIEAMQRVDFLDDLAEDADQGHIGLPGKDLERHAVSVADLRTPTEAVRKQLGQLVEEQSELARRSLDAGRQLTALAPPQTRPFVTALLRVQELRLDAVSRKGGGLADGGASPSKPALLGVLARQYAAALRAR